MFHEEGDHQDVGEVQRVHYGEFVMRLLGDSAGRGQMMLIDNKYGDKKEKKYGEFMK